ncbi:MAG: hypothetical protein ACTTJ3_07710 [Treponema sp.]
MEIKHSGVKYDEFESFDVMALSFCISSFLYFMIAEAHLCKKKSSAKITLAEDSYI